MGPLKPASVVFALLAVASAVFYVRSGADYSPQSCLLTVDPQFIHLGSMRQGEDRAASFSVTNQSNVTVHISPPLSTCGCTTVSFPAQTLAPGEKTDVHVSIDSGTARGHLKQMITLPFREARSDSTRPPVAGTVDIAIHADVVPDFVVTPTQLTIRDARNGILQIEVAPTPVVPNLKVLDVSTDRQTLSVKSFAEHSDGTWEILVKSAGESSEPMAHPVGTIRIETNSSRQKVIRIPVNP